MVDRPAYPEFQKKYLQYSNKIDYPSISNGAVLGFDYPTEGIPFGYQPKQQNPGGLKFLYLDYPFPRVNGSFYSHPGRGWHDYGTTGRYYGPW